MTNFTSAKKPENLLPIDHIIGHPLRIPDNLAHVVERLQNILDDSGHKVDNAFEKLIVNVLEDIDNDPNFFQD